MAVIASAQITLSAVVDVKAVYRYYLLQSSTLTRPSKPITTPVSTPSGWSASEPTYTEGSTNSLYTVEGTVFSDNTWSWSDVQLSSSYEAAKAAYNKAVSANSTANAANAKLTYGTCSTAADTAAKTVSITGFVLVKGAVVNVTFTNANTAANPTLNISSTGAKNIRLNNANLTMQNSWDAGETVLFTYDGTYWVMQSARKTMIATNGLVGESLKRASVSVGYADATTNGDMQAEIHASDGRATSSVNVFPDYAHLLSGNNSTSANENSFIRAYHGQVVSSASKVTKNEQGAEVARMNSTINVYPEYIDFVSNSVRVNGQEIGSGGGAQSDWLVNDPNDPAYVKNRPFYSGDPVETVILNETTFTDFMPQFESLAALVEGSEYTATYNGVEYTSTCMVFDGVPIVGNIGYFAGTDVGIDIPFVFMQMPGSLTAQAFFLDYSSSAYTFKLVGLQVDVFKIDKKYIPDLGIVGAPGEGMNSVVFNSELNVAKAGYAFAEGDGTSANGYASHAEGLGTAAEAEQQHVQGRHNVPDVGGRYAHIVGNGTNPIHQSNAHTLDWDGNGWYAGSLYVGGTSQDDAGKVATEAYVDAAVAAGGGGGGASALEAFTVNDYYGVLAWRNSAGVVTISNQDWKQIPAGGQWSTLVFGTLPEGWRPPDLLQQPVLMAGLQHVLQVLANGTVQLVRTNAQNGAADLWFSFTFVCA